MAKGSEGKVMGVIGPLPEATFRAQPSGCMLGNRLIRKGLGLSGVWVPTATTLGRAATNLGFLSSSCRGRQGHERTQGSEQRVPK